MGYQNFFATKLSTDIGAADTTITLDTAPTAADGRLVLEARNATQREIISYTGVAGNDITGVSRGEGGTSATIHIKGALVEMNVTAEDLEDALNVPEDIETRFDEVVGDHVASGLVWTDDTGLTADMSAGVAYINGIRLEVNAVSNHAFTLSSDTYIDLGDNGVLDYNEETPGDPAPALAADHIRLAKVSTDASDITSVTLFRNPSYLEKEDGWHGLDPALSITAVAAQGNRSYILDTSQDLRDVLSVGMRVKGRRWVTAPLQCTDLEASSSQYWSKANATGFATGTTWTIKAWVKPESYATGVVWALDDATNLVQLTISSNGTIFISGGTHAAVDIVSSYQSISLNAWVEITASITVGTPTGEIRIDGVVVPSVVTGSAATTVTISGDETIYIGRNSGGGYFDGKIAQVAVFNAIISDATLKTYSSQGMTGTETSCEGLWALNGNGTDSSANANTLVAGGGALATATDTPFAGGSGGIVEMGIVTAISSTQVTVQVAEGYAIPTSGGFSLVACSNDKVPYGFPTSKFKWRLGIRYRTDTNNGASNADQFYNVGLMKLTVPIGAFELGAQIGGQATNAGSIHGVGAAIATAAGNTADVTRGIATYGNVTDARGTVVLRADVNLAAATPYYINLASIGNTGTALYIIGVSIETRFWADLAYV